MTVKIPADIFSVRVFIFGSHLLLVTHKRRVDDRALPCSGIQFQPVLKPYAWCEKNAGFTSDVYVWELI